MARKIRETGNGGNDTSGTTSVTGTNGNDLLSGLGAATTLTGGRGDDTYLVDDIGDEIIEKKNSGTDTAISLIDWELGGNLEILTLDGSADLAGTGNQLDNTLSGNTGDNLLDGRDGDDSLFGADGDDTLIGGRGSDTLDGGNGFDTAVFTGFLADYTFLWNDQDLLVTNSLGETDTLRNIEYLSFGDQVISASDIGPAIPDAPQANNDAILGVEDTVLTTNIIANDAGDQISVSAVTNGAMGQVSINADGTITYTPQSDASGSDQFTYAIEDSLGRTSTATVMVQISAVNDAPVAQSDSYSTSLDTALSGAVSVLNNDSDKDADALTISDYDATTALGGTVQMNADGTFTYTPLSGVSGSDSFSYTVSDGNGGVDTGTVALDVSLPVELPYYVSGLLYDNELMRLNNTSEVGTAVTITYTFLDATPSYIPSNDPRDIHDTFAAFTEQQQQITRDALAEIEAFSGLNFVEVDSAETAVMTLGIYDMGGDTLGTGTYPGGNITGNVYSDVWLDTQLAGTTIEPGTEGYYVLLHEIGHAIGLDHSSLPAVEDNQQYTVMDYSSHPTIATDVTGYQLYDIAALQYLYGADVTATGGNNVYDFDDLNGQAMAIWDGGGHDTIDLSTANYGVTLDLNSGAFSNVIANGTNNISIAFGSEIEDANGGAFNDVIIGNDVANRIDGQGGDDLLTGGAGADVFVFTSDWGDDVISDYTADEDILDFTGTMIGLGDLAVSETGGDTLLEYGTSSVLLEGVTGFDFGDLLIA